MGRQERRPDRGSQGGHKIAGGREVDVQAAVHFPDGNAGAGVVDRPSADHDDRRDGPADGDRHEVERQRKQQEEQVVAADASGGGRCGAGAAGSKNAVNCWPGG
jgi:hypothetical protein